MKVRLLALLAITLLPTAHAESLTKPGLWEVTVKTSYSKGGPKLSAEERALFKEAGIDDLNNMSSKRCITPAQAAEEFDPTQFGSSDEDGPCKVVNGKTAGGKFKGDYLCEGGMKGRGVVEARFDSKGFKSFFTFVGTSDNPMMGIGAVDLRSDISGTYLKADCGEYAPAKPLPR